MFGRFVPKDWPHTLPLRKSGTRVPPARVRRLEPQIVVLRYKWWVASVVREDSCVVPPLAWLVPPLLSAAQSPLFENAPAAARLPLPVHEEQAHAAKCAWKNQNLLNPRTIFLDKSEELAAEMLA